MGMVDPCGLSDPSRIGPYFPLARLGVGGFGTVYVATRRDRPGELAAVKVVHGNVASAPRFSFRFAREIAAIKRVSSDYVPRLLDEGPTDQPPWLATELIPGLSLDRVVRHYGPLPEAAVWALAAGVAEGLAAVHEAGLVHRDMKPQNVLLLPVGPRIIDFSLVRLTELPHHSMSQQAIATLQYAAPEQILEGLSAADAPADIFALGATLLYAATGHPPYDADTQSTLLSRVENARPNVTGLSDSLYPVVTKCLLRSTDARPSLDHLREEFRRRAGDDTRWQDAFHEVLPPSVVGLLEEFRQELDGLAPGTVTRWQGAAASPPSRASALEAEPVPLPPSGLPVSWPTDLRPRSTRLLTVSPTGQAQAAPPGEARAGPPGEARTATTGAAQAADGPARSRSSAAAREEGSRPLPVVSSPPDQVRWVHQLGDWARAPVAVGAELVIAACLDGTVTMLSADTGAVLWELSTGSAIHSPALFLPADQHPGGGKVYAGCADGGVHVADVASRSHQKLFHAAAAISGSPVAAGGKVYLLSADGYVHELDQYTLGRDVLIQLDAPAVGTPVAGRGILVVCDSDGSVYAIDLATRRERWRLSAHGLVFGAPVLVAGRLYFAATDGLLRSVDIDDERERAAVDVEAPVHASLVHDKRHLYVGCSDGIVRAFDISVPHGRSGPAHAWERSLNDEVNGLAVVNGQVYATAGDRVVELDAGDGAIRRQIKMNCEVTSAPTAFGRFIYITDLGGAVTCLPAG